MNTIKTSRHTTKFSNNKKLENLNIILMEYRRCLQKVIDYLWENGYSWTDSENKVHILNIKNSCLDAPSFITSDIIEKANLNTDFTGRLMKCCITHAASMIKSSIEKQKKRIYILKSHKSNGKSKKQLKLLIRKIKQNVPQKPNASCANMELNSICADFQLTPDQEFDGFLRLTSLTKSKIDIKIPIKFDRHSNELMKHGKMLNSFLIKSDSADFRWEYNLPDLKESGEIIGCDQGLKTVLTCSNKMVTPLEDKHGYSLDSILNKICRKKRGSKSFKRSKLHQTNFVNWSINQLNLSNIKQINLENIWNIGYKSTKSRKLSHWQNTIIRDKIESVCKVS